jgi:hypothetical protein
VPRADRGAQIAKLAPNYQKLRELDWTAQEAAADVVFVIRVVGTSAGTWKESVAAVVTAAIRGSTSLDEHVA